MEGLEIVSLSDERTQESFCGDDASEGYKMGLGEGDKDDLLIKIKIIIYLYPHDAQSRREEEQGFNC